MGRSTGGPRPGGEGRPAFDGRGQVLDQRYNHGRYYPPVGTVRPSLPGDYRPYYRGRDRYYFNGGIWYAPRGPGFVVVTPPPGLVISVLPPYYSTVWIGGNPYYYADNVYYTWQPDQNGYAVVDAPDGADQPSTPPDPSLAFMTGIGEESVRRYYRREFEDRLRSLFAADEPAGRRAPGRRDRWPQGRNPRVPGWPPGACRHDVGRDGPPGVDSRIEQGLERRKGHCAHPVE